MRTTPADYAVFLRKLLAGRGGAGRLQLASLLGSNAVCTNPATCTSALYTPVTSGASWHDAVGHWVEDDPVSGDGAFSSAGAFGFYPWIDASNTDHGIVARIGLAGGGNDSALCGALVRKAWTTGVALP